MHDYCFSPPAWLRKCSNFENFKKAAIPRMVKFLVESLQPGVERCHVEVFWEGLHDVLEDISTEKIKLLFNTGLNYKEAGDRGQEVIVNYTGLIDALVDEGKVQVPMRILVCAPYLMHVMQIAMKALDFFKGDFEQTMTSAAVLACKRQLGCGCLCA